MNLAVKPGEDSEEGEAEEKEEYLDEPEPEVGPPLLTPLSQDVGESSTFSVKQEERFCVPNFNNHYKTITNIPHYKSSGLMYLLKS